MYGRLVHLEADAVAGAMDELLAEAGVVDDAPGHAIDVAGPRRPGATASQAAACASRTVVVDALEPGGGSPTTTVRVVSL